MEVGSGKSEVGSRKWEGGSRKWEGGSGKSEVGRRKSEVGRRKWEGGSGKAEVGSDRRESRTDEGGRDRKFYPAEGSGRAEAWQFTDGATTLSPQLQPCPSRHVDV
ncbi:MAG: hypothetical protein H6566_02880 [Lewinellaceae bacterium]|nr:hypothetical protein [Lewinellaceae bacterium]